MGDDTISDTTHYVDITQSPPVIAVSTANPAALDKASILSDNTDTATISGIPNPSTFQVTGPEWVNGEVLDGTLAFTTDEPGEYTITITSDHRYLDKEFTIDAN
jgi:hypothetical protein